MTEPGGNASDPVPATRRSPLPRYAGPVLLGALYAMVTVSKLRSMAKAIGDVGDVADDDARHVLLAVHAASGAVFFGVLAAVMIVRHQPVRRERRLIGWVLPIVVTVAFSTLGAFEPDEETIWLIVLGTAVIVVGTICTMYSLSHLGRNFGVVSDVRGFVSSGPYRWVRHPLYASEMLTAIGLLLVILRPLTVVLFGTAMSLQMVRAKVEEQAVTAAFPAYRAYAERTPMLVPLPRRRAAQV